MCQGNCVTVMPNKHPRDWGRILLQGQSWSFLLAGTKEREWSFSNNYHLDSYLSQVQSLVVWVWSFAMAMLYSNLLLFIVALDICNAHSTPPPLGPYKINRVPLRRVDQAYVIATQTKVDIGAIKVPDSLNDDYFKRKSVDSKQKSSSIFQEGESVSINYCIHRVMHQLSDQFCYCLCVYIN